MKQNERLRVKTDKGFIEIFVPEGLKDIDKDNEIYKEFRNILLKLVGA